MVYEINAMYKYFQLFWFWKVGSQETGKILEETIMKSYDMERETAWIRFLFFLFFFEFWWV